MWLIDLDSEIEKFFINIFKTNIVYASQQLLVTDSVACFTSSNENKSILNPQHKVMTMSNQQMSCYPISLPINDV